MFRFKRNRCELDMIEMIENKFFSMKSIFNSKHFKCDL